MTARISRSRENYLIIEQLMGIGRSTERNWHKEAVKAPVRVGFHNDRKIELNILKIGDLIKSNVGFYNDEYVVLRLIIDKARYDLKLHPSKQHAFVWVYDTGTGKCYDLRKAGQRKIIKRQRMMSSVLHISLKMIYEANIELQPKSKSTIAPAYERRKSQKLPTKRRRITD